MSLKLAYEIYYIELFHILSIIVFVAVNYWIYLNSKKSPLLYHYLVVQLMILIWLFAKVFKTVSPNETLRWFFIVTQYFGNCFLGSTFLLFSYVYMTGKSIKRKYILLFNIIPAFFFIVVATNPYHMLFYSYYDYYRDSFGPLFYVHQAYSYTNILIGFIFCAKNFMHQYAIKKMQSLLLSVAILIPLAVNILYIFKLFKPLLGFRPLFDITPIACNLSLMLFALAIFKYNFLDILPNARTMVFNQLPEGVLILNRKDRMIDFNHAFYLLLPKLKRLAAPDKTKLPAWLLPLTSLNINSDVSTHLMPLPDHDAQALHFEIGEQYFSVFFQPVSSGKTRIGTALLFVDMTTHIQIINKLKEKNQQLLEANRKLEERSVMVQDLVVTKIKNHLARELHDILAHSVVLGISMLEVAQLSLVKNPTYTKKIIEDTHDVLQHSIVELSSSFQENAEVDTLPGHKKNHRLQRAIRLMARHFINIGVTIDVQFQGLPFELSAPEAKMITRVIQEGITNAVRHGNADDITIILRYNMDGFELFILDNGTGCANIIKGYGLLGMEERIHTLNGTISFGSPDHSGFCIHATIPKGTC